ncbi:MAG: NADH-quinone oxidoreductase subunit M [Candidatus Omnitrophica bacterium]|nr:NADH-quinone oxidoreductase subunit M [Candidatus Omnitrophota bacterium]
MATQFPYITAILATTLIGALVTILLPEKKHLAIKLTAVISSFITLVLSFILFLFFDRTANGFQFIEKTPWLPQIGITYHVGIDGIGLSMILLTGVIFFAGALISSHEFKPGGLLGAVGRPKEFFALLFILVAGVFGVFVSLDLFFLFLFYEMAVLPMYLLIAIWGTGKKEYSAMKLTLYLLLGSTFILVGILAIFFASGLKTFDWVSLNSIALPKNLQLFIFPLFFVGFGILAGLWPFHTWSPDGHASAPSAVSMLHAGVLMKLGAFGIIRVALPLLPYGAQVYCPFFASLTVVNIVYGALVALAQKDLKYVIAYSSVSHMGIVMFGICSLNSLGISGSVFQMFSHGVMTGLFFALVGCIYGRTHTRTLSEMGGLAKLAPFLAVAFSIGGLASLGLPGTSGFVAELLVLLGAFRAYPVLTVIAATGIVITAIYVLRVLQNIFFAGLKDRFVAPGAGHKGDHHHIEISDAVMAERWPLSILLALLVVLGVYPSLLINLINPGVTAILQKLGGPF